MNAPVVLPVVCVRVDEAGGLTVDLDGEPYAVQRTLGRHDFPDLIRTITSELHSAVRVEVTEADGTTYTDIELPPEAPVQPPTAASEAQPAPPAPGIGGAGFQPGEPVAFTYVVLEQTADDDGHASVSLPASVLRGARPMLLVGLESHVTARIEASP
jgi:hypothetical protein